MAAAVTTGFPIQTCSRPVSPGVPAPNRRRYITQDAGRALEKLAHAIEYLTDEFVHDGGDLSANNPQVKAVQLLMALNRQVYFECRQVPTFAERCRSLLHLHAA
jgi:hypothetical protein